jgi:hypothetical protein
LRKRQLRCEQCAAVTVHAAVVHDVSPRERRREEAIVGVFVVAGVGAGALVVELVLAKLKGLPFWLDTLVLLGLLLGLFGAAVLLARRVLGRKAFQVGAFGKYFEWQCEVCGQVRSA